MIVVKLSDNEAAAMSQLHAEMEEAHAVAQKALAEERRLVKRLFDQVQNLAGMYNLSGARVSDDGQYLAGEAG